MKHARQDYNRIQDPENKIPMDEPVFLLRGQDRYAEEALEYYAFLCKEKAPEVSRKANEQVKLFKAWPKKKIPDLLSGA